MGKRDAIPDFSYLPYASGELLTRARRIQPHITDQAAATNCETDEGKFQRDERSDPEKT
jgi:hypothetical protein